MINLAARLGGGHVTVQHPEYDESPTLKHSVQGVSGIIEAAQNVEGVVRAVPRVLGQALVNTAHESYGAAFIAFDPTAEDETTFAILEAVDLPDEFLRGENAILLGHKLAENLRAQEGDRIVYTLTDRKGEILSGMARLRGTVKTGAPTLDARLFLLPIQSLREAVGLGADEATQPSR